MHIRTMGELHDTINAQALELEQLKDKYLKCRNRLNSTRYKFKVYRTTYELLNPVSRCDKLRVYIIKNKLAGVTDKAKTIELAEMFFLSVDTVRNEWSVINRKGLQL